MDDVIYPLSLLGQVLEYPDVIEKVENIIGKFRESNWRLYGRDQEILKRKVADLQEKIEAAKVKLANDCEAPIPGNDQLKILYTACGPIRNLEEAVVNMLKKKGYWLRSFQQIREQFSQVVSTRQLLSAQYDVILLKFEKTGNVQLAEG